MNCYFVFEDKGIRVLNMRYLQLSILFWFVWMSRIHAYDGETCCKLAKAQQAFVDDVPDFMNQTCGQSYEPNLPPALPLHVPFRFCSDRCGGMDLTRREETGSWTAPIVQFILPSVIFSMTIPRQKKIEFDYLFDFDLDNGVLRLSISMLLFLVILIPVLIDTVIWISTIVVAAGNMIVSGIYEAFIDYRIIKYVQSLDAHKDEAMLARKRELLITIASGNLQLGKGHPQTEIPKAIMITAQGEDDGREKSRSRLLNLLGAQSSFGSAVGSPVLFYLGAFGYTILELYNDPSSQPAAISLGFGIEWMIIVHVAIMSGCLLASNNPSTSSGIVGSTHASLRTQTEFAQASKASSVRGVNGWQKSVWTMSFVKHRVLGWSDAYDTEFQPVSLWARGTNKMKWVEQSEAYRNDESFRDLMKFTCWGWFFKIWVMSTILIVVPPAAGGAVAYFTPPKGLGCRSLSFLVYATCQILLVTFSVVHTAVGGTDPGITETTMDMSIPRRPSEETSSVVTTTTRIEQHQKSKTIAQKIFTGRSYILISLIPWVLSLFSAVGGTLMQIIGVYNNCICYAGAKNWWNLWEINPSVNLASDTLLARNAASYWRW